MSAMKKILILIIMILTTAGVRTALSSGNDYQSHQNSSDHAVTEKQTDPKETALSNRSENNTRVTIETTQGTVTIELYDELAPETVANFLKLTNKGFYDGIIFHRVIPGFMVQTGDPTGTGMGGPGYSFADEFNPALKHDKPGILSMANSGPNTNGSQFFITVAETPWLDRRHAVFGEVVEGMDVVKKIVSVPRDANDRPYEDVSMTKVSVVS